MVAFVKDKKRAAEIFKLGCRKDFPSSYSRYVVEVFVDLLELQTREELQEFFDLCEIPVQAVVVEAPVTKEEGEES